MPLDIGLADTYLGAPDRDRPLVQFHDGHDGDDGEIGGYYWFLYPLFCRLAEQTGQYIDLYGDARFAGDDLHPLRQMLAEARRLVENQPERWNVPVGTRSMPNRNPPVPPWEAFSEVDRSTFLCMLDALMEIVDFAGSEGATVVCVGD